MLNRDCTWARTKHRRKTKGKVMAKEAIRTARRTTCASVKVLVLANEGMVAYKAGRHSLQ